MKKIIAAILLVSVILFSTIRSVNAEEVEDTSTSSPVTETTTDNASDLEIWVEENLGWLVGIPTGTVLAVLAEILVFAKKMRKKDEEIKETSTQNKNGKEILNSAKQMLDDTKTLTRNLEASVLCALNNIKKTDNLVNERITNLTNELTTKLVNGLETLNETLILLENRLTKLEDVQEMIALHSKELVANGTAEEITKKIRG